MQPGSQQFWLWEEQTENLTIPQTDGGCIQRLVNVCPFMPNLIRQSGFLSLPSLVNINKYVDFTQSRISFIPTVCHQPHNNAGLNE